MRRWRAGRAGGRARRARRRAFERALRSIGPALPSSNDTVAPRSPRAVSGRAGRAANAGRSSGGPKVAAAACILTPMADVQPPERRPERGVGTLGRSRSRPTSRRGSIGCPGRAGTGARHRARRHLGARRARGHDRRLARRRAAASPTRCGLDATRRSAWPAPPTSAARCSARSSSAGSPTASAASACSCVTLGRLHRRDRRDRVLAGLRPFALCRFLTGIGIGGEYAAINSAIDELIPARVRGRVDLAINGSFWIGAALGAAARVVLLDPRVLGRDSAGALALRLGAVLGAGDPARAPPRAREPALAAHARPRRRGRARDRAEIERQCATPTGATAPSAATIRARARARRRLLGDRARAVPAPIRSARSLGLALMVSQAFFYNAIFFTYALVLDALLRRAGRARSGSTSCRSPPATCSGRCCSGSLFDAVGRRPMIASPTRSRACCSLRHRRGCSCSGAARRDDADAGLVGGLLLRLGRGELGLPHGERGVPARDARARDRALLRGRHRRRRLRRRRRCSAR